MEIATLKPLFTQKPNRWGYSPMHLALQKKHYHTYKINRFKLYSSIEGDEDLLDHVSERPFPNTPLHYAADKGKTKVAMEIATLKPLFTQKLNRCGDSPMHLALRKKHYRTVRALMTLDPELIRVHG
ncbi:hypothetical protein EUGRSUZ_L00120 [Eucalyptus grandis]|uniref:Uncharacterized protein n=1 Tax=Eucalyptus grandis TaxID=71139 RepID=A0ACC3L4B5_EUCGR|nr:hypothetical protein EUGRSUZ_L00120 [Eucalyptus grandis]